MDLRNRGIYEPSRFDSLHLAGPTDCLAAAVIDAEVKRIIDDCYKEARSIIEQHRDVLERCCSLLMEKEKIGQEEFEGLFAEAEGEAKEC